MDRDQGARYVFGLGNWALESTKDQNCLIATLTTTDGFAACFGIPFDTSQALGWNLMQHADDITEARQLADGEPAAGKLN